MRLDPPADKTADKNSLVRCAIQLSDFVTSSKAKDNHKERHGVASARQLQPISRGTEEPDSGGQLRAFLAVNRELVMLCCQIGRDILDRRNANGGLREQIDRLAVKLKRSFPDIKGFSPRNLKYMRAFAEA
jgi:hypothetical protein